MSDVQKTEPLSRVQIVDRLNGIRHFVECSWMAAGSLTTENRNALQAVLGHVERGLRELAEEIHPARADETGDQQEGSED